MRDWVLWVSDPLMAKHYGTLGEGVRVFDAIDDWAAHPENRRMRPCIEDGYARVVRDADVVFTVARSLAERLGSEREGVSWQPNAVDADRFADCGDPPPELRSLPRPLLGYVGVLQERIDVPALAALAKAMPQASIVLVGPVRSPKHLAPLHGFSNVHFMGERPASQIPAIVGGFDVALVPHVDDALTRSMDPLKVYEYLAAGKPVVASGLAPMDMPAEFVLRADGPVEFVSRVREALEPQMAYQDCREARVGYARGCSWDSRVAAMLEEINEVSHSKGVPA
jgi:glycosyltransferase involved in cell wall biosynthesis